MQSPNNRGRGHSIVSPFVTIRSAALLILLASAAGLGVAVRPFEVTGFGQARGKGADATPVAPAGDEIGTGNSASVKAGLPGRAAARVVQLGVDGPHLGGGYEQPTTYVGSERTRLAIESGRAQPLALVSADFNADGFEDVIGGYKYTEGGFIRPCTNIQV